MQKGEVRKGKTVRTAMLLKEDGGIQLVTPLWEAGLTRSGQSCSPSLSCRPQKLR